jgi:hypothetical protein
MASRLYDDSRSPTVRKGFSLIMASRLHDDSRSPTVGKGFSLIMASRLHDDSRSPTVRKGLSLVMASRLSEGFSFSWHASFIFLLVYWCASLWFKALPHGRASA